MDSIVLGVIALVVGAVVAAYGARAFYLLLPLWGFVTGFLLGGQVIAGLLNEGLFATIGGWLLGFVVGAVFAVLAGLWWWAAVVILMAVVGYEVGSGLLIAIGMDPGFLTAAVGVAAAIALAILAIVLDGPTLLIAAVTAFGGSAFVVGGVYLVFGRITVAQFKDGPLGALSDHTIGLVVWLGLGLVSLGFQYLDTRRVGQEPIERARYRFG
jgi:hypothetical protein